MTRNRLPDDAQMNAWRLAGRLVCDCLVPAHRHVPLFDCDECIVCGRMILGRGGEELVKRTANELRPRIRIARFPDRSEVLIDEDAGTVAIRRRPWETWGPPVKLEGAP